MEDPIRRALALQSDINSRLFAIGIPPMWHDSFSKTVVRWAVNSGIEWTIERIKSLKVDLIRSKADLPPLTCWVKKNRSGQFSGVIGSLFSWASESDKNFGKVLQAFMVYTNFTFGKPTDKQIRKFEEALGSHPVVLDENLVMNFYSIARKFTGGLEVKRSRISQSFLFFRGSPTKIRPRMYWEKKGKFQSENALSNLQYFKDGMGASLYNKFREVYAPVVWPTQDSGVQYLRFSPDAPVDPGLIAGNIGLIQEPGGKLRSVANPYLVHQQALKPIGDAIYGLVKKLPWDCTFDQSKPLQILQDHLSKHKVVHSIDLSSATDLFPMEIQTGLLRSLFGHIPDIDLIETLSRCKWRYGKGTIQWKKGQPLGLYPSFGMFTLTHGMLLWYLNGTIFKDDFFVLGDDVVILNDNLHYRYTNLLKEWKVPFSESKSISSENICEFSGKVITPSHVYPQIKWREISDNNFVDISRLLGIRSRFLLRPRQKVVFDAIKHLIQPFGLGFNPQGLPLEVRVAETDKFLREETLSSSLMGLHGLISKNLYGNSSGIQHRLDPLTFEELLELLTTFDKKVRDTVYLASGLMLDTSKVPPSSLDGFSTIPGVIKNDLPLKWFRPTWTSQLDHYEEVLSKRRK